MKQVEDLGKQLADALHAAAAAESKAAVAEVLLSPFPLCFLILLSFSSICFRALFDGNSNCNPCGFSSFRLDFQIWRKTSDLLRYSFRADYSMVTKLK